MCICTYIYICIFIYVYIYMLVYVRVEKKKKKKFFNSFLFSSTIVIKSGYFHMVGGFHASDGFSVLTLSPLMTTFDALMCILNDEF